MQSSASTSVFHKAALQMTAALSLCFLCQINGIALAGTGNYYTPTYTRNVKETEASKEMPGEKAAPQPRPLSESGAVVLLGSVGSLFQGLGGQYYFTPTLAAQVQLGVVPDEKSTLFGLDGLAFLSPVKETPTLYYRPYIGVGGQLGEVERPEAKVSLGFLSGLVGARVESRRFPLGLYAQVRAGMMRAHAEGLVPVYAPGAGLDIGLQVRVK